MKDQDGSAKAVLLRLLHLDKTAEVKAQPTEHPRAEARPAPTDSEATAGTEQRPVERAEFADEDKQQLLQLARTSINSFVTGAPLTPPTDVAARLAQKRACFVTLTKAGVLRGCIGTMTAQLPLYQAVLENARAAASRDPRFPPVQQGELDELRIEISILTEPHELKPASPEDLLARLRPHADGVLLRIGGHLSTFLPQVWAQIPGKTEFLDRLAEKAGYEASAWRSPEAAISVYQVEAFAEPEPRPRDERAAD